MSNMIEKDFRDMEEVMAKTSLTDMPMAYRLKKFYDNCRARYTKRRNADARIKKQKEELAATKKKLAERKKLPKKLKQLDEYQKPFKRYQ